MYLKQWNDDPIGILTVFKMYMGTTFALGMIY